jgi:hypothetical protein
MPFGSEQSKRNKRVKIVSSGDDSESLNFDSAEDYTLFDYDIPD